MEAMYNKVQPVVNETKAQYLEYVVNQLKTIDQSQAKASYDTGYGLHVVNQYLGTECHALDVRACSILKIRTPNIDNFDQWESAWLDAKAIVNGFTKS